MENQCPNCGAQMVKKTHHETGEEMWHCNECGTEIKAKEESQ